MQYGCVRLASGFLIATYGSPLKNFAHPARDDVHRFDNQQRPLLWTKDKRERCWEFPPKRSRHYDFYKF